MDPYKLAGYNRLESKADTVGLAALYNTDPLLTMWWQVYFQTNDLDVTATTASLVQFRVEYDVEIFGMSQMPVT
jgi:hypothetical protein